MKKSLFVVLVLVVLGTLLLSACGGAPGGRWNPAPHAPGSVCWQNQSVRRQRGCSRQGQRPVSPLSARPAMVKKVWVMVRQARH